MHAEATGVCLSRFTYQWECLCVCRCQVAYVFHMHPTHIGCLSDEPLLRVEDVFDASDQLQRTAVIRALEDKEHMCRVKAC